MNNNRYEHATAETYRRRPPPPPKKKKKTTTTAIGKKGTVNNPLGFLFMLRVLRAFENAYYPLFMSCYCKVYVMDQLCL